MGLSKTRTMNQIEPLSGDPLSGSDCRKKAGNLCRHRAASSVPLIFLLEHARAPLRTTLLHTYPHCLGGGGRIFIVARKRKEKKSGKFGLSRGGIHVGGMMTMAQIAFCLTIVYIRSSFPSVLPSFPPSRWMGPPFRFLLPPFDAL